MNTQTQTEYRPQKTVVKLRFLLPLLVLGYVALGGFVVPHVNIAHGHIVMALLAAASVVVVILAFLRYDSAYRSPSHQLAILTTTIVISMYLAGTVCLHIVCALDGVKDVTFLFLAELLLVALIATVGLIVGKKSQRSQRG